jgi:hypothetical protein
MSLKAKAYLVLVVANRPLRVAATGDETGGAGTSFSAIKKSSC